MLRHRQVRLGYPQEFVELALLLAGRHGRRNCARTLRLPLSTVYRWLEECRRRPRRAGDDEHAEPGRLGELIAACEARGFDLRESVALLEPLAADSGCAAAVGNLRSVSRAPGGAETATHDRVDPSSIRDPAPKRAPTALSPGVRARIALARAEIDRHYYSQLSCEMLASMAGMSRFHFIRTFKAAFGVAPYRYLMQVRIRHARLLLGTTRQPLDAVAAAVGFDTQSSLCKAFRSVEGISLATFFHGMRLGSAAPRLRDAAENRVASSGATRTQDPFGAAR